MAVSSFMCLQSPKGGKLVFLKPTLLHPLRHAGGLLGAPQFWWGGAQLALSCKCCSLGGGATGDFGPLAQLCQS